MKEVSTTHKNIFGVIWDIFQINMNYYECSLLILTELEEIIKDDKALPTIKIKAC